MADGRHTPVYGRTYETNVPKVDYQGNARTGTYRNVKGDTNVRQFVETKPAPGPSLKPAPSSSGGGGGGGGAGGRATFDEFENKANKVKPKMRDVEPEDTVRFHVNELLDKDSPYMQRARYAGERYAADRGLQNTSMAAEASQAAAIDAVLPIAAQDANTYFSQGINNQNTENRFLENKQGFYHALALGEQSFLNNRTLLGDELAARLETARIQGLTSIFSQPGLTAEQQEHAASRLNGIFGHANTSIQRYGFA